MSDIKFSLILLTYNSSFEDIKATLESVFKQKFDGYEILIADDGSREFPTESVEQLFVQNSFSDYKFLLLEKNVGTVQNYLNALKNASGTVSKCIGAGDLLFDENSIQYMYDFMMNNSFGMAFGMFKSFRYDNNQIIFEDYLYAPRYLKPYINQDIEAIKYNQLYCKDYICGASIFGKTDYLIDIISRVGEIVIYSEDFCTILAAFNNQLVGFLDKYIVYYEKSAGISTSGSQSGNNRLKKDADDFWNYISENTNDKKLKTIIYRDEYAYGIKNKIFKALYRLFLVKPFLDKKYRKNIVIDRSIKGFLE